MSFRLKLCFGIAILELFLLGAMIFYSWTFLKSTSEHQAEQHAAETISLLSLMMEEAVLSYDLATLDSLLEKTIKNTDALYIIVYDRYEREIASIGKEYFNDHSLGTDSFVRNSFSGGVYDVSKNIKIEGSVFGTVTVGFSNQSHKLAFHEAMNELFILGILGILLAALFGLAIGNILTNRLEYLKLVAENLSKGNLGYTAPIYSEDDFADTFRFLNRTSLSLKETTDDLNLAYRQAVNKQQAAELTLAEVLDKLALGILITDEHENILLFNSSFLSNFGLDRLDLQNNPTLSYIYKNVILGNFNRLSNDLVFSEDRTPVFTLKNGKRLLHSITRISMDRYIWIDTDITKVIEYEIKGRSLERELYKRQKMEAIGKLASGIAHEVNVPVQYISQNLQYIQTLCLQLDHFFKSYRISPINPTQHVEKNKQDDDQVSFIKSHATEELPRAVLETIEGINQVKNIIKAMNEYAHPSQEDMIISDLNHVVERSIELCRSEWKTHAIVRFNNDKNLPLFNSVESYLSQITINLLINAAQSIIVKNHRIVEGKMIKGMITIETSYNREHIFLNVRDNGIGMSAENKSKVFDPFFTTKSKGFGSGQGLTIVKNLVEKELKGKVSVYSVEGKGTVVSVSLPRSIT